jgi:hypothetical protein
MLRLVAIAVGALASANAAPGTTQIVDRVVAVVTTTGSAAGRGVLTRSQLEFETRVHMILLMQGRTTVATAPLDLDTLRASLTYAIGRRLEVDQADLLHLADVDPSRVADRFNEFTSYLGGPEPLRAFLARYEMNRGDLNQVLERDLRAEHYLQLKLSIESKLSQAEVDKFAVEHADQLAAYPDPEDRRKLAAAGANRDREDRLETAQLRQLYSHAKVRIVDPDFSGADAPFLPVDEGSWK